MIIKGDDISHTQENALDTPPPYSETTVNVVHHVATQEPIHPIADASTSKSLPATPVDFAPSTSSTSSPVSSISPSPSNAVVWRNGFNPPTPPPTNVQRTSCVRRRQENWVLKGQYVIDPYLPIPQDVLASVSMCAGGEVKNLNLGCTNGNVNAEVWVVGGEGFDLADPRFVRKATLETRGQNGFMNVKVHADEHHPFELFVVSRNGGVSVAIPSSFRGPLTTVTQNGWVTISSTLAANVTTFSDVRGLKKCFVGDFATSGYGRGPWYGSSLEINCTNGRIKLLYVDEIKDKDRPKEKGKSSSGFLSRMFSPGSKASSDERPIPYVVTGHQ